jgi:glycosyltransferase involved in cell wall biosynthesis
MSESANYSLDDVKRFSTLEVCKILANVFDIDFYKTRYPDMALGLVDPLEHYVVFGWRERRDPCHWFSTHHYLAANPELISEDVNPFLHYVLFGVHEGHQIRSSDFAGAIDLKVDAAASFVGDRNLHNFVKFPTCPLCPPRSKLRPDRLVLHWLIPDFAPGSGGHMTIFRIIRWLEFLGHNCSIWITEPSHHADVGAACEDLLKHFPNVRAPVAFVDAAFKKASGDAVIATGWETVPLVLNATSFRARFYFIQDFEPSFHPAGSHALMAEWTYTQEIACICAGPWLARTLRNRFGRWTRHFDLACDREIYFPRDADTAPRERNARRRKRITLYARAGTPRRAVELAFLALEHLALSGRSFRLDIFGENHQYLRSPFQCTLHGVLNPTELAELYCNSDLGICFSATNYSLVPQEMMACGLPVVEIDAESTRSVFPGVVTLAGPHPLAISAQIGALLKDTRRRRRQSSAAMRWVSNLSWEKSAKAVEHAFLEKLAIRARPRPPVAIHSKPSDPRATVCIPTYNGGPTLVEVVRRVLAQRSPWPFEVLILDSSSDDGFSERCATLSSENCFTPIRMQTIQKSEFQHGRTRNLCASLARGEFVVFLTQDAMPVDEFWLYNIVSVLERFPRAAGAFGRHIAQPTASPFVKRDIKEHFDRLTRYPLALSRDLSASQWHLSDEEWGKVLHYFSDNNSCLRKSVWEHVPFPEVEFGEDQLWADTIISLGYEKVYAPSAAVYHSHDFTPTEATARAATEAFYFVHQFGYQVYDFSRSFEEQLAGMQHADVCWAKVHRIAESVLEERLALNQAVLTGRLSGARQAAAINTHNARFELALGPTELGL